LAVGEAYPDFVIERCYELWATCRNAEATAHMLAEELGPETQAPSARRIREWVHFRAWTARADEQWRQHHGRDLFELQAQAVAALRLGLQNLLLAAAGAFADNPQDGAIRLKSAELAIKLVEKGVIPLAIQPPEEAVETSTLSRAEKEAKAMQGIARGNPRRRG
jgi:hypothetical protein